jgi:peptide/nickel transport system substrate-binding protein
VAPLYSTLLQLDPYRYPKVIGDVATEWKVAPGGLTYTFRIRQGIRFHDGSALTAADIKATYDKTIFSPQGVRSGRKNAYTAVERVEAPTRVPWCSSSYFRRPRSSTTCLAVQRHLPEEVPGQGP